MPNDVINTVTIEGTTYDINGGGHTIKNPAGTAMTQRSNLQFVDLTISDDSTNDATKVESVHVIHSESELNNLPDGLYMLDEDEETVIDGNLVGYDNTTSGLNAENVQDAIDEVNETITDNNYVDCSTCSTIALIFGTIKQGQSKLKSTAYGVGNIGVLQNTNLKTLLGDPGLTNYVHAYIRPIVSGTNFMNLAEVYAVSTVNTQSAIKRKYIWMSQSSASQSEWETINYMA